MNRKQLIQLNPDFRILDNFAMSLLRRISVTYPQWIKYGVIREFNKSKYLSIRVPAPVNPTDRDLIISVEAEYDSGITVHFDNYHAHFYKPQKSGESKPLTKKVGKKLKVIPKVFIYEVEYEDNAEEQQFEDARLFIEDIINERRVVAIKKEGKGYSACNLYSAELDEIKPGEFTYIRSWRGTYNKTWE